MARVKLESDERCIFADILIHGVDMCSDEVYKLLTKYNQGILVACSAQCALPADFRNPRITVDVAQRLALHVKTVSTTVQLEYNVP